MYHPLPREVQIKLSKIHGEGLFAKEDIDDNTKIGLGWLVVGAELIRTPLGGFINHSDTPNTIKIQKDKFQYLMLKLELLNQFSIKTMLILFFYLKLFLNIQMF